MSSVLTDDIAAACGILRLLDAGVDSKKSEVSTTYNTIGEPHAELVCVFDLHQRTSRWTGKFYPTNQQEPTIVRYPDLKSHFIDFDYGPAMILGCHDLSVYSPGQARLAAGGNR